MTVGELIAALKSFPPSKRVLVRGYEGGYTDPEPLRTMEAKMLEWESDFYGKYEEEAPGIKGIFSAVLIDRSGR